MSRRDVVKVNQLSLLPDNDSSRKDVEQPGEPRITNIYLDTNQMYYIRRIHDEAAGAEYGEYKWASEEFPNDPQLVADIRALCYIVALREQWELDFYSSDASFAELCRSTAKRALATQDAWRLFVEGLGDRPALHRVPFLPKWPVGGRLSLNFIADPDDRVVLRHFASESGGVFLTSDSDILRHTEQLAQIGLIVMRPREWLDTFLGTLIAQEDALDWIERILFGIGKAEN